MKIIDRLNRLKRIIEWVPILWNDEDWDYAYLLKIIDYKLGRMKLSMRDGHATDSPKRAHEISTAQFLLWNMDHDPDDEWDLWYNTHAAEDLSDPMTKEKRKALKLSGERRERNWAAFWEFMSKNMRNWWDVILIMITVGINISY